MFANSSKSMLDECLDLFNDMQRGPFAPNVATYNILINHFGRARQLDAMLALFRTLKNNKLEPDASTYAHLIFWNSHGGAVANARELLAEALAKGMPISVSTFGAFVDMCLAKTDDETCKKHIQEMVDNNMGEVAYQVMLAKYAKEGNSSKAALMMKELQGHGISITPEIYEAMLKSVISNGDPKQCKEFVAGLEVQKIRLSGQAYSELLKFYAYNDVKSCEPLMQKMREWKLTPDLQAFEAMLTVLLKSNQLEECRKVFESMKEMHVRPSTGACNLVLSAVGKLGDLPFCESLLEEMRKIGPFPDRFTYNTILSHSSRARDMARIEKLRELMKKDGIPPTVVVYSILINNASRSFDVEGALRLFDEMKRNRITPDAIVYHDIMLLLLRANDHELVMQFYREMKRSGYIPQLRLYTLLLRHLAAMKEFSKCRDVMNEMYVNGVEPDEKLVTTMKRIVEDVKRNEAIMNNNINNTTANNNNNNSNITVDNNSNETIDRVEEKGRVEVKLEELDKESSNVILCTTETDNENKKAREEKITDVNEDVLTFLKMCTT